MDSDSGLRVGARVAIKDKIDSAGTIAYIGFTEFAAGKWVGVNLDLPKGKNNGTVQGKTYFSSDDHHGIFVRQSSLVVLSDSSGPSPATPRSRLPILGGGTPKGGNVGSRSHSFTDLKGKKALKTSGVNTSRIEREPSFIEPNFVQTMKPPSTSESPISNSPRSERLEEKVAALQAQQNLQAAREEVKDLQEKLETLKIKRVKDQEKLKDFDKMRIQFESLTEFKSRIMESQKELQRKMVEAERVAREAVEAKEKHAEEMSELSETVEMATLDKEMAEEKAETLQLELEHTRERIEELTLDLDIIKAEIGTDGGGGTNGGTVSGMTNFEIKQLQAQNEKLRETLVRMRDLSAHEKNEISKYTKDIEELRTEMSTLQNENERFKVVIEENRQTIADLQDQVDAALGSEEMVDNLTVKCLDLEDKVSALIEEKEDLETLHDMNEELQENAREMELELREELDIIQAKMRDSVREREAAYEIINDHEATIRKFRDLVGKVQEQNADLRSALERETNKPVEASSSAVAAAEAIDFKKMFAETKAHSKAIDMELRQCESDQNNKHVQYLTSFMSESFMSKGGDNEAVLILLLIPRLMWKSRILMSQIKDKFCPSPAPTINRESILKGHTVERYSFGLKICSMLHTFAVLLNKFKSALNSCTPATFLRIGTLFPEMSVHERSVDFYINLLRKNQLDENVPVTNLTKCLGYFENIYPLYLSEEKIDNGHFLSGALKSFAATGEFLLSQVSIGQSLLAANEEESPIANFFKLTEQQTNELLKTTKIMKRRLPEDPINSISFPGSSGAKIDRILKKMASLVAAFSNFGKNSAVEAGSSDPENGLPAAELFEILSNSAIDAEDVEDEIFKDGVSSLKEALKFCVDVLSDLNKTFQNGEWDVTENTSSSKPSPPVLLRSQTYKAQLKEAEGIKYELENKEIDIKELKKVLRTKAEELSEMQVRKNIAEKKLLDSSRDSELMIEKLQRKLEDVSGLLRRKEKEFEETLDQLQADIESLESEKGELKDRVKNMSKKALIEGISKSQALSSPKSADNGLMSLGPSIPCPVKDSPMLLQQVEDLQSALLTLKEINYTRQGEDLRNRMLKLKPILIPRSKGRDDGEEKKDSSKDDVPVEKLEDHSIADLVKRVKNLKNEVNSALLSPLEVVDLKAKPATAQKDQLFKLAARRMKERELRRVAEELTIRIAKLSASRRPGGEISTELDVSFPSPQMARVLNEKDYTMFGKLKIPPSKKDEENKVVPVLMEVQDLQLLHNKVICT